MNFDDYARFPAVQPSGWAALLFLGRSGAAGGLVGATIPVMVIILLLLIAALVFGGFFLFALKWAIIIAIILILVGAFGGFRLNGRSRS